MFELIYSIGQFASILLVIVWGIAVFSISGLIHTKKKSGIRIWCRISFISICIGQVLHVSWIISSIALGWTFGWLFIEDRVFVYFPLTIIPTIMLLVWTMPIFKQLKDAEVSSFRKLVASPRFSFPIKAMLLGVVITFGLTIFGSGVLPHFMDILVMFLVIVLIAYSLFLLQKRKYEKVRKFDYQKSAWAMTFLKIVVVLAVIVVGSISWLLLGIHTSKMPDVIGMVNHDHMDLGGGLPVMHHDDKTGISVTELTENSVEEPNKTYTLTAQKKNITNDDGEVLEAWTFNGEYPGPQLTFHIGDLIEVTLINKDIDAGVTIHWHGYNVPNAMDGVAGMTQDAVQPGETFTYRFRAEDTGTYWYHSHQQSSEQVERGLFGSFVVLPKEKEEKKEEFTSIGNEWLYNESESLVSAGELAHKIIEAGNKVHLRLINSSNFTKNYYIEGATFQVDAIDGQPIYKPGELTNTKLELAAGGRYDVTFEMPNASVLIKTEAISYQGKTDVELLLSQDEKEDAPKISGNMQTFEPVSYGEKQETPFGSSSDFDREFTMILGQKFGFYDGLPNYLWTINGQVFPNTPALMVKEGELIKTTFVNKSFMDHPMHLHGHHMLVLSKNGEQVAGSPWWTDSINVKPGETYEVAFLANNPGMWMDHCHNLEHAAIGMTMHLSYEGISSPFSIGRGTLNQPE